MKIAQQARAYMLFEEQAFARKLYKSALQQ